MYVDGAPQGTGKLDGLAMLPTDVALTIGAWIGSGDSYSTSAIDDVAIYDDMLSAAQVASLYAGTAPTDASLASGTTPARMPMRGVTATASSCFYSYGGTPPDGGTIQTGRPADHACDGTGRYTAQYDGRGGYAEKTDDPFVVYIDVDWTSHEGMWLARGNLDAAPWIQFDLGEEKTVYELVVWNYNEPNQTGRVIQTADIS